MFSDLSNFPPKQFSIKKKTYQASVQGERPDWVRPTRGNGESANSAASAASLPVLVSNILKLHQIFKSISNFRNKTTKESKRTLVRDAPRIIRAVEVVQVIHKNMERVHLVTAAHQFDKCVGKFRSYAHEAVLEQLVHLGA